MQMDCNPCKPWFLNYGRKYVSSGWIVLDNKYANYCSCCMSYMERITVDVTVIEKYVRIIFSQRIS